MAQKIKEAITTKSQLKANPVFTKYLENIKDEKEDYLTLIDMVFPNEEITGYDFKKNHTKGNFEKYVQKTYPEVYNNYTKILSSPYGKMVKEGSDWYKNNPYTPKYDVNSDEAKAIRAKAIKRSEIEAKEKIEKENFKKIAQNYGDIVEAGVKRNENSNSANNKILENYRNKVDEGVKWFENNKSNPQYDVNSDEAKAARAEAIEKAQKKAEAAKAEAIEKAKIEAEEKAIKEKANAYGDRVAEGIRNTPQNRVLAEYAYDDAKVDWGKSEKLSFEDSLRPQDLKKRIDEIENNESVKKALNFTTRSDGSMSYSSKKDYEAAQKFINEQEAEYVNKYTNRLKNDAKYKLDEKISSFVNNKNWEKEFGGMGAQQKVGLMSNLTEAQINMVKKKGLDLENIANWSEEQMGSVVKGLKEAEYMNDVRENLTREFREGVNQRANLAGYNKIASRESSVASEMSKKMSGFKSVGKLAIGGALMYGLISALSDSGGQQSNAQLYGQQPLY